MNIDAPSKLSTLGYDQLYNKSNISFRMMEDSKRPRGFNLNDK